MNRILSQDYFKIQPSKFLEQTVSGAILSICTILFVGWLIFSEINWMVNEKVKSELQFENLHIDNVPVNLDMDIFGMPCEIVDLQFKAHHSYSNSVTKYNIVNYVQKDHIKGLPNHLYRPHDKDRPMDQVYEAYKNGDGCRFIANVHLNFLSNSFMVGFSNIRFMQKVLQAEGKPPMQEFRHEITRY